MSKETWMGDPAYRDEKELPGEVFSREQFEVISGVKPKQPNDLSWLDIYTPMGSTRPSDVEACEEAVDLGYHYFLDHNDWICSIGPDKVQLRWVPIVRRKNFKPADAPFEDGEGSEQNCVSEV